MYWKRLEHEFAFGMAPVAPFVGEKVIPLLDQLFFLTKGVSSFSCLLSSQKSLPNPSGMWRIQYMYCLILIEIEVMNSLVFLPKWDSLNSQNCPQSQTRFDFQLNQPWRFETSSNPSRTKADDIWLHIGFQEVCEETPSLPFHTKGTATVKAVSNLSNTTCQTEIKVNF